MDENQITQQQGGTPPDLPSGGNGGGTPPDGQGGSSSSSVSYSAATSITSGGSYSNQTYTSTTANQNALLIDTSDNVTLNNPTVTKSGSGDGGDNSSFYGTNAGVLVKGGSTTTINGGSVTTSANGANGVFSYGGNGGQNGAAGDGTTIIISDVIINTTGDASGGIMTTGGGVTRASNLTVNTTGQSSAPIRSDRGGGSVTVSGGSYTSSGLGSPAIYSTADITVQNATLTSNLSEGVCIEGQNSVTLANCTLTANNTRTNGNAQFLDAVILYQSQSGDAASGTATFNMTGGKLLNKSGHLFHVTNTAAVINLNDVDIDDSGAGVLLSVCDDGWSGASNVATLNATAQELTGNILVGDDSTLTLNLTGGTTFSGNISGAISNASGSSVSSEVGTVNVSLDSDSKWYLVGDAYISSFSGSANNVITGNHTLYVNGSPLSGTTENDTTTPTTLTTALNIENVNNNTLITGTAYDDSISNYGANSTINALAGNDSIFNAEANGVSVSAGAGDDSITNLHAYNVTLDGGAGNDRIVVIRGNQTTILGGAGNDSILGHAYGDDSDWAMGGYAVILGGNGNDFINPAFSDSASILGDAGNDTIINGGNDSTINGGAGNDVISLQGASLSGDVIKYDAGDGNDFIYGFNENVRISLAAGTAYSSTTSGDDLILTVGRNFITIAGGAYLSTINVINYEVPALNVNTSVNNTLITGTELADTIINGGSQVSIVGAAGDDSITNNGARANISGDTGNDTITNSGASSTVLGATGDDRLINTADRVSLDGNYGNDTIENSGSNVTISAGSGNNTVSNSGNNVVINFAGGYDSILGFNNTSTLRIGNGTGSYSVEEGVTNILVSNGDDIAILQNAMLDTDTLHINGDTVAVGKVIQMPYDPIAVTVSRNNVSVKGGVNNDTINVSGSNVTINAAAGNDRIQLGIRNEELGMDSGASRVLIEYSAGDGNDVITGFTADSTLSIGGAAYSSAVSGDDVVLTVGNGKITLQEGTTLDELNIVGATSSDATDTGSGAQGDVEMATSLVGAMLYRTEAGYPVIAGIAFHPEEYHGDEPTNYASKETWTIESSDGLELNAVHYTPENSNDKWVVIIHGYGHNHKHMYPFAGFYLANGYNILMVDQRAAGDSEGDWLTMGTAESADIALWTQEIARHNSDAKITLFGVSMGAATAMMAAARSDTKNVTSLVEDCGYSNVVDIINLFNSVIFNEDQETIDLMMPVSESLTGYNLKDAAPINSIASVTVPSLFITGGDDSVVGGYMLSDLYDASGAEVKETFIVPGAGHGVAGLTDPVGYSNTVFRFVAEADGEGWNTANITDNISLRGTSYNDTIANSGTNVTIDALGGDDFLVNDVDSSVTTAGVGNLIYAGDGNDTIYNHHSYRPTLIGGNGNDSIVVSRGHMTYVDAGAGNDTIIGRKVDTITGSDWEIGGYATVLGGDGNDYINTGYSNSASIDGGAGNDTIYATGNRITINGGEGRNLISVLPSSLDADNDCAYIIFNGNTTVQGFKTGFGNGSDTVYIPGNPAAVDFKSGVLTFYDDNNSLTLQGVTTTAKVNLYHESRQVLNKGVFIAENDWYSVESGDLSVRSGEEVYFVGPSASPNRGVDFSGISSNLNVTLDTAYIDSEDYVPGTTTWINGVYSIRGGAGNTTIRGSAHSDTIVAGSGRTTIDGAGGNDRISLGSAAALIKYTTGGGNDSIIGFNGNSTLSIGGGRYSSATSGDDLILTVGADKVTLFGAASLENPHILGTLASSGGSSTSGGGSSSTTSGGGSSTSDGDKKALFGTDESHSIGTSSTSSVTPSSGSYVRPTTSGSSSTSTTSGGGSSTVSGSTSTTATTATATTSGASISEIWRELTGVNNITTSTTSGTSSTTTSGSSSTAAPTASDYVYRGGDAVISDYTSGQKITLGTAPTGGAFVNGNFVLSSSSGSLVVENATGKVITFEDGAGNDYLKAYEASAAGIIDGRGLAGYEIINGSSLGSDEIYAGDGGSELWGGTGTASDLLIGGGGADIFVGGRTQGADIFRNASSADIVRLNDATLSDIIATAEQNGLVAITFNNGNAVAMQSTELLSAAVVLSDGLAYRYNHAARTWQTA